MQIKCKPFYPFVINIFIELNNIKIYNTQLNTRKESKSTHNELHCKRKVKIWTRTNAASPSCAALIDSLAPVATLVVEVALVVVTVVVVVVAASVPPENMKIIHCAYVLATSASTPKLTPSSSHRIASSSPSSPSAPQN